MTIFNFSVTAADHFASRHDTLHKVVLGGVLTVLAAGAVYWGWRGARAYPGWAAQASARENSCAAMSGAALLGSLCSSGPVRLATTPPHPHPAADCASSDTRRPLQESELDALRRRAVEAKEEKDAE